MDLNEVNTVYSKKTIAVNIVRVVNFLHVIGKYRAIKIEYRNIKNSSRMRSWSAYFVRAQLTLSRYIHMHISADKQDIAGGQAEEKEAQMKMLKVMPATRLLMKIDNKKIVKLKHRHGTMFVIIILSLH